MKFDIRTFHENLSRKLKFGYNRAKILVRHEDLNRFFVAGDNKSPQKLSLRPKFHQAVSPSVCPQVISAVPNGRITVKFNIGDSKSVEKFQI